MNRSHSSFWWIALLLLVSMLAAFGVYYNALSNGFIWDDPIIVDKQATAFLSTKDIFFPPAGIPEFGVHYYRPLVMLSFIIDKAIWGKSPFGFHLSVVLIHVLNTILVFYLSRIIFRRFQHRDLGAFISSLLFALHPIHTESVVWIAGRSDVLAALFFFLSLIFYFRFRESSQFKRRSKARWLILSALIFFLACLAKEASVALIFLLPIIDVTLFYGKKSFDEKGIPSEKEPFSGKGPLSEKDPLLAGVRSEKTSRHERRRKERAERKSRKKERKDKVKKGRSKAPLKPTLIHEWFQAINFVSYTLFILLTVIYLIVRHYALYGGGGIAPETRQFFEMLKNFVNSYGFYTKKLLLPIHLKAFNAEIPSGFGIILFSTIAIAVLIVGIVFLLQRKQGIVSFSIFFFFLTLLPSVMVAILAISETALAERYLYIPSFSLCLLMGYAFLSIPMKLKEPVQIVTPSRIILLFIILIVASLYSIQTVKRNRVWKNDLLFWEDVIKKGTDQGLPHLNLGLAYAQNEREEEAIKEYQKALESKSKDEVKSLTYNSLGALYLSKNDYDRAEENFTKAISLRPRFALPYYNMAVSLWKRYLKSMREDKRHDKELLEKASTFLDRAVRVNPQYANAHNLYGKVLVRLGRHDDAIKHLETVLKYEKEGKIAQSAKNLLDKIKTSAK